MTLLTRFIARRASGDPGAAVPALPGDPGYDYAADQAAYPLPEVPSEYPYVPTLVDVETPADHTNNTCHPSVVDTGMDGWNGYRWWMANTPYPPEADENPIVVASNDRVHWVEPREGMNPLVPSPRALDPINSPNGYNNDTELWFDGHALHCWWGAIFTPGGGGNYAGYGTSTDGVTWETKYVTEGRSFGLSPMANKVAGSWTMHTGGGEYWIAPAPDGPWSMTDLRITYPTPGTMRHGDILYHGGIWYGIGTGASTGGSFPRVSLDGITWTKGGRELFRTPDGAVGYSTYRPTILPSSDPDCFDVWVSVMGAGRYSYDTAYSRVPKSEWLSLLP